MAKPFNEKVDIESMEYFSSLFAKMAELIRQLDEGNYKDESGHHIRNNQAFIDVLEHVDKGKDIQ